MENERRAVSFDPFFGGFILETLTVGMYGEARNAIREYIQNGFDSVQRAIHELQILPRGQGLIEIELSHDRKRLTIRDNGAGLPTKTAATVLTRVGASSKSHRKHAGFRGIGRLAGIVFSDTVIFSTKAKGENEQSSVVFDAKTMREAMGPNMGSKKSAVDVMNRCVKAYRGPTNATNDHFFEVSLDGLRDAPEECYSANELYDFVSQVAPVPYPDDFPYREELRRAEDISGILIEEVQITIRDGRDDPQSVRKRYGAMYSFDSGSVRLTDCDVHHSPTKKWWAWIGKKEESGAYTDTRVSGLRVRVRNIQINGKEVIRDIFRDHARTHERFQDYFLGEIFVQPSALVPNARRDGFEEDATWKSIRTELATVIRGLGSEAYRISNQGQLSINALSRRLKETNKELNVLRRTNFDNTDRVIKLSTRVTTLQKRVAKAMLGASMEAVGELQAIGSRLSDIKQEALSRVADAAASLDREQIQQEARDQLLSEILFTLEENMSTTCFAEAEEILMDEFGEN